MTIALGIAFASRMKIRVETRMFLDLGTSSVKERAVSGKRNQ